MTTETNATELNESDLEQVAGGLKSGAEKGVVLTSETQEPSIKGVVLSSETQEPTVKGVVLTSESQEPTIKGAEKG